MKNKILTVAKVLISFALLVNLFRRIDFVALAKHFSDLNIGFVVLGLAVLLFQVLLSSIKWNQILKIDGISMPVGFLWKTYLISGFFSLFLPTNIGGDFYRVYKLKDANHHLGKSTSSVLFDRLTGLFALISIGMVASLFILDRRYISSFLFLFLAVIVSFLIVSSNSLNRKLRSQQSKWPKFILSFQNSFNVYRKGGSRLIVILIISILFQFNIVLTTKIYALALGIKVPFSQLLVIVPVVSLLEAMPVSINGLGIRESAYAFFFQTIGRTSEEGVAISLLTFFMRYILGGIGVLLWAINTQVSGIAAKESESDTMVQKASRDRAG